MAKKRKRKKSLYRATQLSAGGFLTKYFNNLTKARNYAKKGYHKGYSGTLSKLNKKTNRFRKIKKIGWN